MATHRPNSMGSDSNRFAAANKVRNATNRPISGGNVRRLLTDTFRNSNVKMLPISAGSSESYSAVSTHTTPQNLKTPHLNRHVSQHNQTGGESNVPDYSRETTRPDCGSPKSTEAMLESNCRPVKARSTEVRRCTLETYNNPKIQHSSTQEKKKSSEPVRTFPGYSTA
jgi:hypothetical protein